MKIYLWVIICGIGATGVLLSYTSLTPRNDREWTLDQQVLPTITRDGDMVHIDGIRNFAYTSTSTYTPSYYSRDIDMRTIRSVDFIVEPFESIGAAHTFLSFGFDDGTYLAISVEIRKEVGESFSPWKGLIRQYELMYVIADERDVINLRANYRNDIVYLYPTTATKEEARALFEDMILRAEKLRTTPEFYNTLTNNCTTNIVAHINTLREKRLSWDYRMLFPKNADVLARELGFILPHLSIDEGRAQYQINEKARTYKDDPEFSSRIREIF